MLTAGFGQRPTRSPAPDTTPDRHLDPRGNRVVAPAAGTVVKVGIDKGYGRFIQIAHGYA